MATQPDGKRSRIFVPLEVASFLRAPYGWTNRMRREEGYPARGESHRIKIGFWASLGVALAAYGPLAVGAVLGWRGWGGWLGAGLGALVGALIQVVVFMAVAPVVLLVRSRRH